MRFDTNVIGCKLKMSIRNKKAASVFVVILAFALLLTACGGAQGNVNVTLGIFTINMPSKFKAGQVTFHVSNTDSTDTHEFIIFKTDIPAGQLSLDSDNNVDETAPGLTKIDELSDILPGDAKDLTVTLDPGNYVALCNLPGHYQAGMYAGFTVQ